MAQNSGLYEFCSCALCREVSIRELSAKYPSLPLVLDIALVQPLSNIHNQSEDLNKDF